ncbi:MAG: OmpH family outer membrane protein [Polyangiaceae bacterium]|nr:OmpH family outer membrane protein [Polyangiaceae bacterium]
MPRISHRATLLTALVLSGCAGNPASQIVAPPTFVPVDQTKCGVTKSQARPLIVEWPSADRAALELQARKGVAVVRYAGCEMEVLRRCKAPGAYVYTGLTRKDDRIAIRDDDELYANIPVHAAKFEAQLKKSGQLDIAMTIVGAFEADRASVRADELDGDCAGATHVITGLTAGAFEFSAGAAAEVGGGAALANLGAGATSAAKRQILNRDGDKTACERSTTSDPAPPEGCGALLRVEVVPLGEARRAAPACPEGTAWDGKQCVRKQVMTQVECPPGSSYERGACVAAQRVAQVSWQKLLDGTAMGRAAKASLKTVFDARQRELDARQTELKDAMALFERQRTVLSAAAAAERERRLAADMVTLQQLFAKYNKELADLEAARTKEVIQKLTVIAGEVAAQQGFIGVYEGTELVWSQRGQEKAAIALSGAPRFDLTDAVRQKADATP